MNEDPGPTDDISQLWGAEDKGAWEPAPLRRPVPPVQARPREQNGGNGYTDRLDALEQDVRDLVRVVERVEALVNERLSRLERQVEELTAKGHGPGHGGIGRLSGVLRSPRNH